MLVLECGHAVSRKRRGAKNWSAVAQSMFISLDELLAPKSVQCHYCGSGCGERDPWILIEAIRRSAK